MNRSSDENVQWTFTTHTHIIKLQVPFQCNGVYLWEVLEQSLEIRNSQIIFVERLEQLTDPGILYITMMMFGEWD